MDKKKIRRNILRVGTGFIAFAGTLVGGYVLTPNKVRTIKFDLNTDDDHVNNDTYFNRFLSHVKNAADVDSEETISGMTASFEGFELTWGEQDGLVKNDIKLDGDIQFKMNNLNDLSFTIDLDLDYNGKDLDLAVGFVDRNIYFALKDLKLKSTVNEDPNLNYTQQILETLHNLYFNPEYEGGLGISMDLDGLLNGLLGSLDLSSLMSGMGDTSFSITEDVVGDDVVDTIAISMSKNVEQEDDSFVKENNDITIKIGFEQETANLKYIDLGTISIAGFTIKGRINCSIVENLKIYPLDSDLYPGKKRDGFVEVISYISWADKLLNFLQSRKLGLELNASLSLDGKTASDPSSKLADISANVDLNLENLFDLSNKTIDENTSFEQEKTNENEEGGLIADLLNKVAFGVDLSVKGQEDREYANLGVHYKDNVGYLSLNEETEEKAVMRAKISTSTVSSVLAKVPTLIETIGGDENKEKTNELFSFITSSELVTAIKDGRYDGILDVLETLRNDNKTITLGLNLSSLGLGENAKVTLVLDASNDANARVLNLDVNGVELGTANLDLSLKTKEYSDVRINQVIANKDRYDDLNYLPSVFDQVSSILDSKQAGFTLTGSVKDSDNLGLNIDGWGQFDYGNKFGYGQLNLDQYKTSPSSIYAKHVIKLDVDNSGETYADRNVKFTYGENDGIKGKFTIQTITDIIDLVKTFIDENGSNDRFTKFVDPLLETFGVSYIGDVISSKDYVRFASSEVIKEIKEYNNEYIQITINGGIMSLDEDLVLRINFSGSGENRTIAGISLPGLTVKGKTIRLALNIKDFDANKKTPVNMKYTFMDFSQIKVLLEFGINTTMQNYYHLTADVKVNAISIFNISVTLDFHIYVDGVNTKVYGVIEDVPYVLAVSNDALTDVKSELVFEPDSNASGNDIGGYFHILRTEVHKGLFSRTTEKYYYRSTSKNFINSDNLVRYLVVDMLDIKSGLADSILSNDTSGGNKAAPKYEECLNKFQYNESNTSWDIGLNLEALTGMSFLGDLDLTITGKTVSGKGYLSTVKAGLKIYSVVSINADIKLLNAGSSAADWGSTNETKYNNIVNIYNNMSSSKKTSFDTQYLNKPLADYQL